MKTGEGSTGSLARRLIRHIAFSSPPTAEETAVTTREAAVKLVGLMGVTAPEGCLRDGGSFANANANKLLLPEYNL